MNGAENISIINSVSGLICKKNILTNGQDVIYTYGIIEDFIETFMWQLFTST